MAFSYRQMLVFVRGLSTRRSCGGGSWAGGCAGGGAWKTGSSIEDPIHAQGLFRKSGEYGTPDRTDQSQDAPRKLRATLTGL